MSIYQIRPMRCVLSFAHSFLCDFVPVFVLRVCRLLCCRSRPLNGTLSCSRVVCRLTPPLPRFRSRANRWSTASVASCISDAWDSLRTGFTRCCRASSPPVPPLPLVLLLHRSLACTASCASKASSGLGRDTRLSECGRQRLPATASASRSGNTLALHTNDSQRESDSAKHKTIAAMRPWLIRLPAMLFAVAVVVLLQASGAWLLDLSAEDCVTSGRELVSLESRWHSRVSDRYTQLVFIGAQMDEEAIRIALDDCCLTQKEMDDALREDEDDEDEEEDAVADAKQALMQAQIKRWPLLQPLLAFDTDPNAEPTCALRQ